MDPMMPKIVRTQMWKMIKKGQNARKKSHVSDYYWLQRGVAE